MTDLVVRVELSIYLCERTQDCTPDTRPRPLADMADIEPCWTGSEGASLYSQEKIQNVHSC